MLHGLFLPMWARHVVRSTGDDIFDAGAGSDTLNGGQGIDELEGGAGNDTYYVDNDAADLITEEASQGTLDWVAASIEKFSTTSSGATTALVLTRNIFAQIIVGGPISSTA